ncbi:MAG: CPBP family intramembrane glutamic endopeptidase [Pseudomonadota bacterium]
MKTPGIAERLLAPSAFTPKTPWRAWPAFLISLLLAGILLIIALRAMTHSYWMLLQDQPDGLSQLGLPARETAQVLGLEVGAIISQLIFLGLLFLLSLWKGGRPAGVMALGRPPISFWKAGLICATATGALLSVDHAVHWVFPFPDWSEYWENELRIVSSSYWPLLFASAVLCAPLIEELWFRGFLFSAFIKSDYGLALTALLTGLLWTVLHIGYPLQTLAVIFIDSLVLSALIWKYGSVWLCIAVHALLNGAFLIQLSWYNYPG